MQAMQFGYDISNMIMIGRDAFRSVTADKAGDVVNRERRLQ